MKKILYIIWMVTWLIAQDDSAILSKLDNQRFNVSEGKISINIETTKKGKLNHKSYKVMRKSAKKSLILFQHASEKGTVILRNNNTLYLKVPTSKSAIRITPMQRLFGDVSIGDVLEIAFNEHYNISKHKDNMLLLKAKTSKETYATIELFLEAKGRMNYANLYAASGKKLKTVKYQYNDDGVIDTYLFESKRSKSKVKILSANPMKFKESLFRKANLKRSYKDANRL